MVISVTEGWIFLPHKAIITTRDWRSWLETARGGACPRVRSVHRSCPLWLQLSDVLPQMTGRANSSRLVQMWFLNMSRGHKVILVVTNTHLNMRSYLVQMSKSFDTMWIRDLQMRDTWKTKVPTSIEDYHFCSKISNKARVMQMCLLFQTQPTNTLNVVAEYTLFEKIKSHLSH